MVENGHVTVPGFYDDMLEISAEKREVPAWRFRLRGRPPVRGLQGCRESLSGSLREFDFGTIPFMPVPETTACQLPFPGFFYLSAIPKILGPFFPCYVFFAFFPLLLFCYSFYKK